MDTNLCSRNLHLTQPICNTLCLEWTIAKFGLLWANWFEFRSTSFDLLGSCCKFYYRIRRKIKQAEMEDSPTIWEINISLVTNRIKSEKWPEAVAHIQHDHEIDNHSWCYYILGRDGTKIHATNVDSADKKGLTFELIEEDLNGDSKLLNNGCLEFRAELRMLKMEDHHQLVLAPVNWPQNFDFNHLLETGNFSDFTIVTDDESFRVHKAILAARSSVFRAMLGADMKESNEGILTLDLSLAGWYDTKVIKKFLEFIYTDELVCASCELADGSEEEHEFNFELATNLLRLADQYEIPKLKVLCEFKLMEYISDETIVEILRIGDTCGASRLVEAGLRFVKINRKLLASQENFIGLVSHSTSLGEGILKAFSSD